VCPAWRFQYWLGGFARLRSLTRTIGAYPFSAPLLNKVTDHDDASTKKMNQCSALRRGENSTGVAMVNVSVTY